jgi:hypothetical protein
MEEKLKLIEEFKSKLNSLNLKKKECENVDEAMSYAAKNNIVPVIIISENNQLLLII